MLEKVQPKAREKKERKRERSDIIKVKYEQKTINFVIYISNDIKMIKIQSQPGYCNYENNNNNNKNGPICLAEGSVNSWHTFEFNGFTVEWWYWVISFFASVFSNITSNKHSTLHSLGKCTFCDRIAFVWPFSYDGAKYFFLFVCL